jgi:hypothetical protein
MYVVIGHLARPSVVRLGDLLPQNYVGTKWLPAVAR